MPQHTAPIAKADSVGDTNLVLVADDQDLPKVTVWRRSQGTATSGTYAVINTTIRYAVPGYDQLKAAVTDANGDPDPNKSVALTVETAADDETVTCFGFTP